MPLMNEKIIKLKEEILDLLFPKNRTVDPNEINSVLDIVRAEVKFRCENNLGLIRNDSEKLH